MTFSLSPSGGGVGAIYSYQWYLNSGGSGIGSIISGATNATYNISSVGSANGGTYSCVVSDNCGSTTADVAQIILNTSNQYFIYGKVVYDNNKSSPLTNDVRVVLKSTDGSVKDSVLTDSVGNYYFKTLAAGNYILSANTTKAWGGGNPLDALKINRYFIGSIKTFGDALKNTAADVNDDGEINPLDALLVNRRFIGIVKTFTSSKTKEPRKLVFPD